MLANRLSKRFRHLSKWSAREDAPCFRVYERDIPEFPLVIDWYEGEVVVWFHPRTRDDTPEREESFHNLAIGEICAGLQVGTDRLWIKRRERQRGLAQYERMGERNAVRTVREQGLRFEVNLSDFLDTGLFLDHRTTRRMVRERSKGRRVLNLFAYTGSFTSYAAHGGARATRTVDMSRTYRVHARRLPRAAARRPAPRRALRHHRARPADLLQQQADERLELLGRARLAGARRIDAAMA